MKKLLAVLISFRWFWFLVIDNVPAIGRAAASVWGLFLESPVAAVLWRVVETGAEAFPPLVVMVCWVKGQSWFFTFAAWFWKYALLFYVPVICLMLWLIGKLKIDAWFSHRWLMFRSVFRDMHIRRQPQDHVILRGRSESGSELNCDLGDKKKVRISGGGKAWLEDDGVYVEMNGKRTVVPWPDKKKISQKNTRPWIEIDGERFELEVIVQTV